jgi:purine-nucleoside phosphorylase
MASVPHASSRAVRALTSIRAYTDLTADLAIVLGSGLGDYADQIEGLRIPYGDIDGFPGSTAPNHKGVLHIGTLHGRRVVAMQGRLHLYEGHTPQDAAFPIEVAQALGAKAAILTNVSGSLNPNFADGETIGVSDHIYLPGLSGQSPLVGRRDANKSPFVNLTRTYDQDWLQIADQSAVGTLQRGIYACLAGPHFETPAEGRMLRLLGADMVGMSTVHESIIARYLNMKVLGLSLIVNPVITDPDNQPAVDEAAIWKTVDTSQHRMTSLLDHVIRHAPID